VNSSALHYREKFSSYPIHLLEVWNEAIGGVPQEVLKNFVDRTSKKLIDIKTTTCPAVKRNTRNLKES
jgi:hypothetical protein